MDAPKWDDLKPVSSAPNWDDLKPVGQQAATAGLGGLWEKALNHLPPEIREQAAQLMPNWQHNPPSYSPYKPADPNNMPNDAVNPVGTDSQMVNTALAARGGTGIASAGKKILDRARGDPPPPPQSPVDMSQMPTQTSPAMQWAQNMRLAPGATPNAGIPTSGGTPLPPSPASGIPSNPITSAPPLPGTTPAQAALLEQAIHGAGHMLGGPIGGIAARIGSKMLGM